MNDIQAKLVIEGLVGELEKCIALVAAQRHVIVQRVGDKWDTQIDHLREAGLERQKEEFLRLRQKMLYDAPGSDPLGEWQTEVQRLIESAENQEPPEQ